MKKFFLFSFAVTFLSTALLASTSIQTQSQYFGGTPYLTGSLTFNQFDNTADTLESIGILLYLQSSGGNCSLDNDSNHTIDSSFQFGTYADLDSADIIMLDSSFTHSVSSVIACSNHSFTLAPDNGDGLGNYDFTGPDGLSYNGDFEISVDCGLVDEMFWSLGNKGFLGTGTFNISYSLEQWLNYGSYPSICYGISPSDASGFVTVIYTYDSAPEPTSILLFSLGMLFFKSRCQNI